MAVHMDCFGATHPGCVRQANQDQFLIADLNRSAQVLRSSIGFDPQSRMYGKSRGKLLVMADGIGGAQAGDRASTLVVDSALDYILNVNPWFFHDPDDDEQLFEEALKGVVTHCHDAIVREASAIPLHRRMGTTFTMSYIVWPKMYLVHVGDCRCYVFRQGQLHQLTQDQTLQQLLQNAVGEPGRPGGLDLAGNLQREDSDWMVERAAHVLWNAVTADAVGLEESAEVDTHALQVGDVVLLATDGLYRELDESQIMRLLSGPRTAKEACDRLIQAACEAGGRDNITAIVARFSHPSTNVDAAEEVEEPLPDSLDQEPKESIRLDSALD